MADLLKFVNRALHSRSSIDVYLNRLPRIGSGRAIQIESKIIQLTGAAKIVGYDLQGDLEILMPDASPSGKCTVKVNGSAQECDYRTEGGDLIIDTRDCGITMRSGDQAWSWVWVAPKVRLVPPAWIGIWPTTDAVTNDDFASQPKA